MAHKEKHRRRAGEEQIEIRSLRLVCSEDSTTITSTLTNLAKQTGCFFLMGLLALGILSCKLATTGPGDSSTNSIIGVEWHAFTYIRYYRFYVGGNYGTSYEYRFSDTDTLVVTSRAFSLTAADSLVNCYSVLTSDCSCNSDPVLAFSDSLYVTTGNIESPGPDTLYYRRRADTLFVYRTFQKYFDDSLFETDIPGNKSAYLSDNLACLP